jgi:Tfp pilus assembly protein PilN
MIKINLADKKRSEASDGGTGAYATGTISLRNLDLSALKDFQFQKLLVPLVLGIVATVGVGIYQDNEIKKLDVELESINAEKPKLQEAAGKMKSYEDLRASMEADEFVIRTKLDTIRQLIQNRGQAPKFLEDLAQLTPPAVWLADFSYDGTAFDIRGNADSFKQVSPFLKALNENPFFQDLTLKDSQTAHDAAGHEIVSFELVSGAKK